MGKSGAAVWQGRSEPSQWVNQ